MNKKNNYIKKINTRILISFAISIISFIVAIILGNQMHSDDTFYDTYLFPQAGEGSAVFFWLAIICLVIGVYSIFKKEQTKIIIEENLKKEKTEEEIRIKNEFDDKSKKIYAKYIKEGYEIENDSISEIICKSYNITKEELISLYNRGKEIEESKQQQIINNKKEGQLEIFNAEKEKTKIFGKNKYLNLLNERYEGYEAIQKLSKIMSSSYISGAHQAQNVRETDPYIFGGIADGIAGPAAGLMTASRIQKENERRKAEGKIIAENSLKSATRWSKEASKAGSVKVNLKKMIDNINEALIIDELEELKDKIKFKNTKYKILDTKNFEISTEYLLSDLNILNKEALLDGSFKISVIDKDNTVVATGYYNAGNVDVDESANVITSNMGLNIDDSFEIICISNDYKKIDLKEEYQIKIEPINLWLIEINWKK